MEGVYGGVRGKAENGLPGSVVMEMNDMRRIYRSLEGDG